MMANCSERTKSAKTWSAAMMAPELRFEASLKGQNSNT